ncbi:MAG: ABC transporter ATP-binding protein [Pseudomonadota bacterium]
MLVVDCLVKSYGAVRILDQVTLSVDAGETVALVGESGSGKSTLLHLIAGLDSADSGHITLNGTQIGGLDDRARASLRLTNIGLIFQQYNLVQSLTVTDNIALQARLAGRYDDSRARDLVKRLGLEGLGSRYPEQLSGGQQQRVAIARALAAAPDLLLADEPTGNLDESTGDAALDLMLELVAEAGMTLILVTHSPRLAARAGRVVRLQAGHVK